MPYKTSNKMRLAGCAMIFVILFVLFGVLPLLYVASSPYTKALPRRFNPETWKAADRSMDDTRCAMLADLRMRIGIEGKTREELGRLLGPDDGHGGDEAISTWPLCPSFLDVWILEVRWENGVVVDSWVRDT